MQILTAVLEATEEIGGVQKAIWETVIERYQLWGPLGGKK